MVTYRPITPYVPYSMRVSVMVRLQLLMIIYHFLVHVRDKIKLVVILLDHYSHPVYVPIRAKVISYIHIPHKYWAIYENIS